MLAEASSRLRIVQFIIRKYVCPLTLYKMVPTSTSVKRTMKAKRKARMNLSKGRLDFHLLGFHEEDPWQKFTC